MSEHHWDWDALLRASRREARRLLADRELADDAAQEAVLRAWRRRAACRQPDDPLPWVRQIARHEAVRAATRDRRDSLLAQRLPPPATCAPALDDDGGAERLDVRRALAQLPAGDRVMLVARYAGDLTQPALAERLGIAEGTAKVRLHRARRRLAVALTEPASKYG
jgi:RNA polymerase sigma-70 factor, ECF subfamily